MKRYVKKPVIIDAIRNDGSWKTIIDWLDALSVGDRFRVPVCGIPPVRREADGTLQVDTLEGTMRCDVGDWLIRGVEGEFYPCKDSIFLASYEPVEAIAS